MQDISWSRIIGVINEMINRHKGINKSHIKLELNAFGKRD